MARQLNRSDLVKIFESEELRSWLLENHDIFKVDFSEERTLQAYLVSYLLSVLFSDESEFTKELICVEAPQLNGKSPDLAFLNPIDLKRARIWIEIKAFFEEPVNLKKIEADCKKMSNHGIEKIDEKIMLVLATNSSSIRGDIELLSAEYTEIQMVVISLD